MKLPKELEPHLAAFDLHDLELLVRDCARVCADDPDSHAVQTACLCYGGNSFAGPMKDGLKCDRNNRSDAILARYGLTRKGKHK